MDRIQFVESLQISVIFSRLSSNIIRNKYLKYWTSLGEYSLWIWVEFANNLNDTTGKTGDVERSSDPTPVLALGLWAKSWSFESRFLIQWTSFSYYVSSEFACVRREIMERVAGSRSELILYFKSIFKRGSVNWEGTQLLGFVFYRAEAPQQAEARSTKIVFVGWNFSFKLSPATYWVRFLKWIVWVRTWQMLI